MKWLFLAACRWYWRHNKCTQCDTDPSRSFSHRCAELAQTAGVIAALDMLLIGFLARDWDGSPLMLSFGKVWPDDGDDRAVLTW